MIVNDNKWAMHSNELKFRRKHIDICKGRGIFIEVVNFLHLRFCNALYNFLQLHPNMYLQRCLKVKMKKYHHGAI